MGSSKQHEWTPAQLGSNLLGWLNADRADKFTFNGSQVSHWFDLVANYDFTQSVSGSRPLYSATGWNSVSPGVTFDGVDDELTLASVPFPSGATTGEIWALVDQKTLPAVTSEVVVHSYGGDTVNSQRRMSRLVNTGVNNLAIKSGTGAGAPASTLSADFSGRHVARVIIGATTITAEMDGVQSTPTACVSATGTNRSRVGAAAGTSASLFINAVFKQVLWTAALSASDASLLRAYLTTLKG